MPGSAGRAQQKTSPRGGNTGRGRAGRKTVAWWLDGSRIVSRVLSGRAREVYANLDQFLPLFILAVFFLLPTPILNVVGDIAGGICRLAAGGSIC